MPFLLVLDQLVLGLDLDGADLLLAFLVFQLEVRAHGSHGLYLVVGVVVVSHFLVVTRT